MPFAKKVLNPIYNKQSMGSDNLKI